MTTIKPSSQFSLALYAQEAMRREAAPITEIGVAASAFIVSPSWTSTRQASEMGREVIKWTGRPVARVHRSCAHVFH